MATVYCIHTQHCFSNWCLLHPRTQVYIRQYPLCQGTFSLLERQATENV